MDFGSWYVCTPREAMEQRLEHLAQWFIMALYRDFCDVVGIPCFFVHALTPGFLRCRCGISSDYVPGMCAIRWQLVHSHLG